MTKPSCVTRTVLVKYLAFEMVGRSFELVSSMCISFKNINGKHFQILKFLRTRYEQYSSKFKTRFTIVREWKNKIKIIYVSTKRRIFFPNNTKNEIPKLFEHSKLQFIFVVKKVKQYAVRIHIKLSDVVSLGN